MVLPRSRIEKIVKWAEARGLVRLLSLCWSSKPKLISGFGQGVIYDAGRFGSSIYSTT